MTRSFLWITETEVAGILDMRAAIAALKVGLDREARGEAQNMTKTHVLWGKGDTLHAIGAVCPAAGVAGTKTWAHTEGGATPLLLLFDAHDGSIKAIIEAFVLGQFRTAGISGLATRFMAAAGADDMALIGTGKQALAQLAAVAAVRRLRRVRVFSPTPEHRQAFVANARSEFDLPIEEASNVAAAVRDASIITLVTRAREPFLTSDLAARGAHINAVGAIAPERIEFAPDLLDRCGLVVADSVPQARNLSREFIEYFEAPGRDWARVRPLSEIVATGARRPGGADLTLFKALGMGISDLSLGIEIYRRAVAQRLGRGVPHPVRAKPRLRAEEPASQGA